MEFCLLSIYLYDIPFFPRARESWFVQDLRFQTSHIFIRTDALIYRRTLELLQHSDAQVIQRRETVKITLETLF